MILLLAFPAGAAAGRLKPAVSLEVAHPAVPLRDTVLGKADAAAAQISASASSRRYSIGDGSGATIAVDITEACARNCQVVDPQRIADFIGTLIHGSEVSLLTVQLDTEYELGFDCGLGAEACYYVGEDKIVIGGYEEVGDSGDPLEYVLAHEYGHHVAAHRRLPVPFGAAVNWGTERWASVEHVCQGRRRGRLFPGNEGSHYFQDPGEAFAEAFARYRFPDSPIRWQWLPSLRPGPAAFEAIREDTLEPWRGRSTTVLKGRVPARGEGAAVEHLRTPLDGTVTLRPGGRRHGYELALRGRAGRLLRRFRPNPDPRRLDYTVCGQPRLRLFIRSTRPHGHPFRLQIQRP
ncbi:MAG: hypothetical protein ACM3N0_07190 [Chloroflexota bacterium]